MLAHLRLTIAEFIFCFCYLVFGISVLCAAQSIPFYPIDGREILTNGIYFSDRTKRPQLPIELTSLGGSPLTATNFYALGWDEIASTGDYTSPPDTHGAVSPDFCLTMLNTEVRVQTRAGQEIQRASRFWWWTNGHPELTDLYRIVDPRVLYDPFHHRWIATVFVNNDPIADQMRSAGILVGVSLSSHPTNSWNIYRIYSNTNGGTNIWIDQPTIGFNKDWIVVHGNVFNYNQFSGSYIWVFNKTNLYAGGTNPPTVFTYGGTNKAGSIVPATTLDNTVSTLYLAQNGNGTNGVIRLFSITGEIGSETLNYMDTPRYITNGMKWAEIPSGTLLLPQKGTAERLNATDTRIINVVYRNGHVWCAQNVFLPTNTPTRCAVQWWCFNPTDSTVVRQGRIDDSSGITNYCFPSIAVNRFNDVLIGYGIFHTNIYPSGQYSFRAFFDQPVDALRDGRLLKAGEGAYTGESRWGDYSATLVDPVNDADFWTIQEYSTTNAPRLEPDVGTWGTWWGHIKVDFPANDYFTNSTVLNALGGTLTNFTYRAGKETGETNHHGNAGGASVWYVWTPTNNSQAVIQTAGSSLGAVLAVYTGSSVSNLTLIGSDFTVGGGSKVMFDAIANTTYRLAVDGYDGHSGHLVLSWSATLQPVIVKQPQSTNVIGNVNEHATFSTEASGSLPLGYQWRQEGTNIPGATATTLTRTNVQVWHATNYTVVVSNNYGMITSATAALFVHGDSAARMFPIERLSNGVRIHVFGVTNRPYRVDTSTNLNSPTNWYPIHTNWTSFWYTNLAGTNDKMRFYRAITNN